MEYIKKVLNLSEYTNYYESFELFALTLVAFIFPFLIGHPQYLVGIIVNSMLILSALNLKSYKILPVVLAPSLGVLAKGLVFGSLSKFLLLLIPSIWIGNLILVFTFKAFRLKHKRSYFSTLVYASFFKSIFLFGSALILYKFGLIPVIFLTAFGVIQLLTSLGGGFLAYGIQTFKKKVI
jgi:hypothetical protein